MTAQAGLTSTEKGYGWKHQKARAKYAPLVAAGGVRCARCGEPILPGQRWDLGHVDHDRSRYAGPEHANARDCPMGGNRATAGRRPWHPPDEVDEEPEREGIPADDPRWDVPWLAELREAPPEAVWPRLMTLPHPRAVGSLGPDFIEWAEDRTGRPLRWWQRLVATRLLEHDAEGVLVWEAMVLTMARQLGKSWLLRELCLWRIHQAPRFGEPQDVMHTGKDLAICKEVQRVARIWAKARPETFKVREVNGQEEIEVIGDGSRWMLRAKEAVYGYGVSFGAVDEAWKVRAASVDDGLTPTMAERMQPQLLLISTAHRLATSLMLGRRAVALTTLENGAGDLLIEWSTPRGAELDDLDGWRLASPHWTPQRERIIGRQLAALQSGEIDDPEEPDPEQSFRAQWLNQWPRNRTDPPGGVEDLLPPGLWAKLAVADVESTAPLYVALEDDYGFGAAVACVRRLDDGRLEVDAWLREDWDTAIGDVERLGAAQRIREFHVGASMLDRVPLAGDLPRPRPAVGSQTRVGLALVRDLAVGGDLVHDETTRELDQAFAVAKVKETVTGLQIVASGPTHLLRAVAWAVQAAHRRVPMPAVH